MSKVLAYHPSYSVQGTGETIQVSLDDWYEDAEVLKKLGKIFNASTVKELVEKIKSQPHKHMASNVLECRVCPEPDQASTPVKPGRKIK